MESERQESGRPEDKSTMANMHLCLAKANINYSIPSPL